MLQFSFLLLWIHVGFSADPNPPFYLNADPDPEIQTATNPGHALPSSKCITNMKIALHRYCNWS